MFLVAGAPETRRATPARAAAGGPEDPGRPAAPLLVRGGASAVGLRLRGLCLYDACRPHGGRGDRSTGSRSPGLMCLVGAGLRFFIQPLGKRLDRDGSIRSLAVGMCAVILGMLAAVLASATLNLALVLLASAMLGCGYGLVLVCGLQEVQRIARRTTSPGSPPCSTRSPTWVLRAHGARADLRVHHLPLAVRLRRRDRHPVPGHHGLRPPPRSGTWTRWRRAPPGAPDLLSRDDAARRRTRRGSRGVRRRRRGHRPRRAVTAEFWPCGVVREMAGSSGRRSGRAPPGHGAGCGAGLLGVRAASERWCAMSCFSRGRTRRRQGRLSAPRDSVSSP
ncbi:hypothetical protein QJS66_11260 [Kocuria rhizophila]|nr:hypothetical protein QJS66_11260 [Kocuria rhizophila]